jgi:allantoate deiminase
MWMREAGMKVWTDVVGNVHGQLEGSDPSLPMLLIGSHYDTVLDAGM